MLQVQEADVDVEQLYRQEQNPSQQPTPPPHYLNQSDFVNLFDYEENNRSASELKRDFQMLQRTYGGKIKHKYLVGKFPFA